MALKTTNGKIMINSTANKYQRVFAGGDCVNGGKEVVDAVQAGKEGRLLSWSICIRRERVIKSEA